MTMRQKRIATLFGLTIPIGFALLLLWQVATVVVEPAFGQTVTVDSTQSPVVLEAVADIATMSANDGQMVIIKTGTEQGLWRYSKTSSDSVGTGVLNGPGSVGRLLAVSNSSGTFSGIDDLTNITADEITDDSAVEFGVLQGSSAKALSLEELKKTGVQVVNVLQYGAVGDGVADDTAAIQAAIDAIGVAGGVAYIPSGTFLINSTLTLPDGNDFRLIGNGNSSVLKAGMTDGSAVLDCNTAQHFSLEHFAIKKTGTAVANFVGIDMTGSQRYSIDNVTVYNATVGVVMDDSWIGSIKNLFIRYCTTGFTASDINDVRGDIHIENVSQGFEINVAVNATLFLIVEGLARTQASTIDGLAASTIHIYTEESDARTLTEFAFGATTECMNSEIVINGANVLGSTAPPVSLDNCDGLTFRGVTTSNNVHLFATATSRTRNIRTLLRNTTQATGFPVSPPASYASQRAVNFIPDALFELAIPGSLSATRCTAAEENSIVPAFSLRSLKVDATDGTANNYATKSWALGTYTHMAQMVGHPVGVATWIYVPNVSFYTHGSPGPDVYVTTTASGFTFTADASTNTITAVSHGLPDGAVVTLSSTTTLPGGLGTYPPNFYYVINRTNTTFQLSTTSGGSAVDITDAGTGTHTCTPNAPETTNRSAVFSKGNWILVFNELWIHKGTTAINVNYYANRSATNATSETIAYFVGPVMWIGGLRNSHLIANGQFTDHPDAAP